MLLLGCEVQTLGARCDTNTDCDPNTTAPTAVCTSFSNPGSPCSGGDCVCCPTDPNVLASMLAAAPVGSPLANCQRRTTSADGGVTEGGTAEGGTAEGGTDASTDAADAARPDAMLSCSSTCNADSFCDTSTGMCRARRPIGQDCSSGDQCQTTFCVGASGSTAGVCCISACRTAGYSCSVNADQRGLCLPAAGTPDAGTPDATTPDASAAEAGADASAG